MAEYLQFFTLSEIENILDEFELEYESDLDVDDDHVAIMCVYNEHDWHLFLEGTGPFHTDLKFMTNANLLEDSVEDFIADWNNGFPWSTASDIRTYGFSEEELAEMGPVDRVGVVFTRHETFSGGTSHDRLRQIVALWLDDMDLMLHRFTEHLTEGRSQRSRPIRKAMETFVASDSQPGSLVTSIQDCLSRHGQMPARSIAKELQIFGYTRRQINKVLYSNPEIFDCTFVTATPLWSLR